MKELVFATVILELKKSWGETTADPDFIELLYASIIEPLDLSNKKGDAITVNKSTASKIVNRQRGGNPNKTIRNNSDKPAVLSSIENYFGNNIVKRLLSGTEDDLIQRLSVIIQNDSGISEAKQTELLALANKKTLAKFLASVFLYSLSRNNVLDDASPKKKPNAKGELEDIPVPDMVSQNETKYTDALLAAYGQVEGITTFTVDMLDSYPEHKDNFTAQRKYYFAAEAVRRGTRDLYGPKEKDQFEVLKEEMYEGVTEVWEDDAKNGLVRMRKVLAQATRTSLDKCLICRDTTWVGNSQRKGVCHFLVEDNRLKGWVRDDD